MKNHFSNLEIKHFLNDRDIPVVGFASPRELSNVPAEFAPQAMLGEVQSIIIYGVSIPIGILHARSNALALYWRYCNMLYRSMDIASNQLSLMLEQEGHPTTPIYGCYPWKMHGRAFWGLLPLVYWAQEAGLGRLTRSGLLATPDFGTRILFGGVMTSMELEPTPKITEDICPDGCRACIEACPVRAISDSGKVDHNLCVRRSGANPLLTFLLRDKSVKQNYSFDTLLNTVGVDDHGSYTCFDCVKSCPLNQSLKHQP